MSPRLAALSLVLGISHAARSPPANLTSYLGAGAGANFTGAWGFEGGIVCHGPPRTATTLQFYAVKAFVCALGHDPARALNSVEIKLVRE